MSTRRTARVAEAIRETVSTAILFELRDPRVKNVTVLKADVTPDLRHSKVYVSVMGDAKTQALTMRGLESACGFLQAKVAERLMTKTTPELRFVLDQSVKMSLEAAKLLDTVFPEGSPSVKQAATASEDIADDGDEIEEELEDKELEDSEAQSSTSPEPA